MIRTILAVIAGYIVMVIGALAGIGIAWLILGGAGAFQEGSTVASNAWSATNCVFGLLAAILGGIVASAIGKHPTGLPVKVLAVAVLAVGILLGFTQLGVEPQPMPEGKSAADLTFVEAGAVASSPAWYNFFIPFVGAVGVLIGGRLKKTA